MRDPLAMCCRRFDHVALATGDVELTLLPAASARRHSGGVVVGRPSYHDKRHERIMYVFDPSEQPRMGVRLREWTAVASTEPGVIDEMARCLRNVAEGRVPR